MSQKYRKKTDFLGVFVFFNILISGGKRRKKIFKMKISNIFFRNRMARNV